MSIKAIRKKVTHDKSRDLAQAMSLRKRERLTQMSMRKRERQGSLKVINEKGDAGGRYFP
jgi:hypothetical protein